MKNIKTYGFILGILYSILFILKKAEIYFPVISDYLADLICVPLTVITIQLIMNKWVDRNFETGLVHVLVTAIYFSIVFEWMMPAFSSRYTADFTDVLCYFAGGTIFYLWAFKEKLFFKRMKPV